MAPYWQLVLLENQTRNLEAEIYLNRSLTSHLSRVDDDLNHVTSDLGSLLHQVGHQSENLVELDISTNNSLSHGALLLENISSLQDSIQELQKVARLVNRTTQEKLTSANQMHLLEELESMLQTIRSVNLTAAKSAANQELGFSESLIDTLQGDIPSRHSENENRLCFLITSLNVTTTTLQHAAIELRKAAQLNTEMDHLLDVVETQLHQYQSFHQNLSLEFLSMDELMVDSQLLLEDTMSLTEEFTNSSTVELLASQLDQWPLLLRRHVDALVVGLIMTDALKNVYRAENHTQELQRDAHSLHSYMMVVCNMSHNTSQLAQLDDDITEHVNSAHKVTLVALTSASLAVNMTGQSKQVLSEESRAKMNISSAVLDESQKINYMAEDLQLNVTIVTTRLQLVRDCVFNFSLLLNQPTKELQTLPNGSFTSLQQALDQTATARSRIKVLLLPLQRLKEQLQVSSFVVENTNNTVRETNRLMAHTQIAVNEAQQKLEDAEHRTQSMMEKIKPLNMLEDTLKKNLSNIRELIDQARKQAALIKVAVQADRDCIRSYRPQIQSRNFNTLSLILKTSSPDNLLFYLGSNTTVDFLAVEMHDGKAFLLWNVGSGTTRLEFPGTHISNNRWTRINATRIGAHGALSVHQLDSELAPRPAVTKTSPGTSKVLDINRNTVIHVGGLGAHTQIPAGLQSSTFQGCLGEAVLDETNIGLWNYNSQEGKCGGCFSSPQAEETSFHFDGSGFSVVYKSLRATSTSIVLLFKTLSPGGLLLYLASNNMSDFLSLELVEGHVRLNFDLGSGALIQTSNRKYNTGVWYKITLQRNKQKGYLSIMAADQSSDKEVMEAESPGTASSLNRSDLDPIYIGGLPFSTPISQQVVSRFYVGCIKDVEIARSNFDLLRDAYGVQKGCVLMAVRSVSMLPGGFVQITPPSFSQEVELFLTFFSNNQSGLLLAVFGENQAHRQYFLSVHLISGAIEVEFGDVDGATWMVTVMKSDGGSFSEGRKHSVIVSINRKSLSLQVDEEHLKSVPLMSGGLSQLSPFSLFIGGVPPEEKIHLPTRLRALSRSFTGCIQHLVMDKMLVDLSAAVRYEGAELNSCLLEDRARGAMLPENQDIDPTSDSAYLPSAQPTHLSVLTPQTLMCVSEENPTFLPSAAQFGSSRHSHMTFIINPSTVRKRVSVRLVLRSRALEGVIILLSGSKLTDFVALNLKEGRVRFSADLGKGPASITSSVVINDGEWHTVSAEVSRRLVWVSVDGSRRESISIKGNQLDVDKRLYLGGLPRGVSSRRINVSSSFPGCVQSISLNGAMLDLSKANSKLGVSSCFTKDRAGSYFNGSGYAELMHDGYKVGSDLSVSLEFQTSHSEGVFLGISSAKVDAIGLEMVNGQVVFNINNGAGQVSVRSTGQTLCDGQWHHLLARKTKHILILSVDEYKYTTTNPYPQSTSAETNNPVYLGGYPVGVKQNCLTISSRFRGCLRNLQLIRSHLSITANISAAHFLLGVTPESCPGA